MSVQETEVSPAGSTSALLPDRSLVAVNYLNTSPLPDMGHERVYPTLRLRLREPPLNCGELLAETPAIVSCPADCPAERQTGGRSSSPGLQSRQAVTQPRRVSTPTLPPTLPAGSFDNDSNDSDSFWLETQNFSSISDHDHNDDHNDDHNHDREGEGELTADEATQLQLQLAEQIAVKQRRLTFEQWLQSKKKLEAQRRRQHRREAHRVQHLKQMRQQMSERSYAEWLHSKRRLSCAPRLPAVVAEEARKRSEQRQRCVAAWQQRKQQELERRRERLLREQQERHVHEQLRRRLSQLAWQRWLTQLATRSQSLAIDSTVQPQQQTAKTKPRLAAPADKRLRSGATPPSPQQQQQQQQQMQQQQRRLQYQVASLYLHVPLSTAQRALRRRLDNIDAVRMHRQRRKS